MSRTGVAALGLTAAVTGCAGGPVVVVELVALPGIREETRVDVVVSDGTDSKLVAFGLEGASLPRSFGLELTSSRSFTVTAQVFDAQDLLVGAGAATIDPVGAVTSAELTLHPADFQVNTGFAGRQRLAWANDASGRQLAISPEGDFAIAWTDDCGQLSRCDIHARRFDANADALDSELAGSDQEFIANRTPIFGNDPALAVSPEGRTLVAWTTFDTIEAVVVSETGAATGVAETVLSSSGQPSQPAAAAFGDDGFIVAWAQGDLGTVLARQLTRAGAAIGTDLVVSTSSTSPRAVDVAVRPGGDSIAFVWREVTGIRMRLYTDGVFASATELVVAQFPVTDDVWSPRVAFDPEGGLHVFFGHRQDGDDDNVLVARRVDPATGARLGSDTVIGHDLRMSDALAVALGPGGTFGIAWTACATSDDETCGIYLRRMRPDGLQLGPARLINTTVVGDQSAPSLVGLADRWVAAWTDASESGPDRTMEGIRARLLYPERDQPPGQVGADCDPGPCGDGLVCVVASDDVRRCHDACSPSAEACPDGGECVGGGCVF